MKLNLPNYQFKIRKNTSGKDEIFDEFRKKYVALTPEEWVRQNFIRFLKEEKKYPSSLIAIEKGIVINSMKKRFDAVVHNRDGKPIMLIEFKSPDIKISQKVMDQISRYNINLNVNYLLISNGLSHYCCYLDKEASEFIFLKDIPDFIELNMKGT